MKTISEHPLAIGTILHRRQQRLHRRELLRRLFSFQRLHDRLFPPSRTHIARISPSETVESNLPLR